MTLPVLEHLGRGPRGGTLSPVIGAHAMGARIEECDESAATQSRGLRLNQAQYALYRDGRIGGAAPRPQHAVACFGGEWIGRDDHFMAEQRPAHRWIDADVRSCPVRGSAREPEHERRGQAPCDEALAGEALAGEALADAHERRSALGLLRVAAREVRKVRTGGAAGAERPTLRICARARRVTGATWLASLRIAIRGGRAQRGRQPLRSSSTARHRYQAARLRCGFQRSPYSASARGWGIPES